MNVLNSNIQSNITCASFWHRGSQI